MHRAMQREPAAERPPVFVCAAVVVDSGYPDRGAEDVGEEPLPRRGRRCTCGRRLGGDRRPFHLKVGKRDLYVDLGAERPVIAATRGTEKIAVEVQSFVGPSAVADLERALGQYVLYRMALFRQQPDRPLFLAVPTEVYDGVLTEPIGEYAFTDLNLRVLVFEPTSRQVVRWIS